MVHKLQEKVIIGEKVRREIRQTSILELTFLRYEKQIIIMRDEKESLSEFSKSQEEKKKATKLFMKNS